MGTAVFSNDAQKVVEYERLTKNKKKKQIRLDFATRVDSWYAPYFASAVSSNWNYAVKMKNGTNIERDDSAIQGNE